MRIVAGTARGRRLKTPRSAATIRPTADRVRETLFNVLGQWAEGLVVLDLFAGTGALALEALSRGARHAVLVDRDREAIALCRSNAEELGFLDRVRVISSPVERAMEQLEREGAQFDLIFVDPPYASVQASQVLPRLEGLLEPGGRACLEHDRREELPEVVGRLRRSDERRFGDTLVTVYQLDEEP